ncbi:uracil-DNA glycosylase family protein [Psychroflexus salis]|uniref:Uracil-DNA glycosylase-like domain-containing protein n=1 Tax=Psychroflexus salis TaxID=1526574 RepID=A0A916ZWU7_9FLAO|nr:uracil-DNA glycosylase family protein [Psychroflexus salis]GGE15386.1 hypothetical protein GCM10010831_15900 [Psychroflexus salis]
MNLKISFDNNLKDFNKLKYIIVGNNPGNDEYKEGKYFIGSSGTTLRKHFLENNLVSNFDEECIIFNKTFLSTKGTDGLIQVKKDIGEKNFNNILIHTAHEIANFSNNLDIPIFILGKSKLDKGKIFHPF